MGGGGQEIEKNVDVVYGRPLIHSLTQILVTDYLFRELKNILWPLE